MLTKRFFLLAVVLALGIAVNKAVAQPAPRFCPPFPKFCQTDFGNGICGTSDDDCDICYISDGAVQQGCD